MPGKRIVAAAAAGAAVVAVMVAAAVAALQQDPNRHVYYLTGREMPLPVVADHVPHRAPRGARGGASPLLGDAMGKGHGRDASGLGDHDVRSSSS